jgi:hypothetical protein
MAVGDRCACTIIPSDQSSDRIVAVYSPFGMAAGDRTFVTSDQSSDSDSINVIAGYSAGGVAVGDRAVVVIPDQSAYIIIAGYSAGGVAVGDCALVHPDQSAYTR